MKAKKQPRRVCPRCNQRIRRRDPQAYTPDHDPPYWHRACLTLEQSERGAALTALGLAITILQTDLAAREVAFHRLTQAPLPVVTE